MATGPRVPFGEPGGVEYDEKARAAAEVRADLCAIAQQFCLQHGPKIVDAILDQYVVKRRSLVKELG